MVRKILIEEKKKWVATLRRTGFVTAVFLIAVVFVVFSGYFVTRDIVSKAEENAIEKQEKILKVFAEKVIYGMDKYFENIEVRMEEFSEAERMGMKSVLRGEVPSVDFQKRLNALFWCIAYGGEGREEKAKEMSAKERQLLYSQINAIIIYNADGKCVARSSEDGKKGIVGNVYAGRALYREALNQKSAFASTLEKSPISGKYTSYLVVPLWEGGTFLGLIASGIRGDYFARTFIPQKKHEGVPEFFVITYIDGVPRMVAHREPTRVGEALFLIDSKRLGKLSQEERKKKLIKGRLHIPEEIGANPTLATKTVSATCFSFDGSEEIEVVGEIKVAKNTRWYLIAETTMSSN